MDHYAIIFNLYFVSHTANVKVNNMTIVLWKIDFDFTYFSQ